MAATLTGTPVAVVWASGSNPAGQSITIPADATAVYMFWTYYTSADGNGLSSVTLNSVSPDQTFEIPTAATDQGGTGVAVWYNPATGSRTLDPAWDASPTEGPVTIVAFVKDGDTTAWRDADADNQDGSTACSVTLTTVSGDLVLKFDQRYDTSNNPPALSSGWTNGATTDNNSEHARLSYISATGTTQACNSEDEAYSTVVAVSIPAASSDVSRALTGQSVTVSAGSVSESISYPLSGSQATIAQGSITETVSYQLSGIASTASSGSLTGDVSYGLAGSSSTVSSGTVTPVGGDSGDVSKAITGEQSTISSGSLISGVSYSISGSGLSASSGSVGVDVTVALTGIQLSVSQGTIAASGGDIAEPQRSNGAGRPKKTRKKQERVLVTIDNETFNVSSQEEAVSLLKKAAVAAQELAIAQSQKVVELRKRREKRDGYLNKTPIKIDAPSISVSFDNGEPAHINEIEQIKDKIIESYREAAENAEIALLIQKSIELDNDEALVLLLLE